MKTRLKQLAHKSSEDNAMKSHPFNRYYYREGDSKNIEVDYRAKHNNTDIYENLYTMAVEDDCSKGAKKLWEANKEQAALTGDFVVDLDMDGAGTDADVFNAVKEETIEVVGELCGILHINEEQLKIYWSGGKGFHVVVPYSGYVSAKNLNKAYLRLAMWLKRYYNAVDLTLYDEQRVCRVVNSIHGKTGMYCVRVSWLQLQEISLEEMKMWASTTRPDEEPMKLFDEQIEYLIGENSKRLKHLISCGFKRHKRKEKTHQFTSTVGERDFFNKKILDFKKPGRITDSAIEMSVPRAIDFVKSCIDMEELTGLHGQFCDIFHEDHSPSACWLPPDDEHHDWVYKCSSASAELAVDSIGFTMNCLQCSPMEALRHLCSKVNIRLVYNGQERDVRDLVRKNKSVFKDFSKIKGAKTLVKALKDVYYQCCDDVVMMAEKYNMAAHGDDVYGSASQRHIAMKLGGENNNSHVCKKLILLASLGLVQRVLDEDLPFHETLKTMPFYQQCKERYGRRTIQYYRLSDLSCKETRRIVRQRLRTWLVNHVTIKEINRSVIYEVFGEAIASQVYAKHDALWSHHPQRADAHAIIDNGRDGDHSEAEAWLRDEMREYMEYGFALSTEFVFVPTSVA